jgi:hypothetical protein
MILEVAGNGASNSALLLGRWTDLSRCLAPFFCTAFSTVRGWSPMPKRRRSLLTSEVALTLGSEATSDGTRASKSIVSGQAVRFPSRMALDLSSVSLTITTPCGCIRPSAMLPPLIGSPAATSRSSSSAIAKLELARQNRKTKRQSLTKYHCFE